MNFKESLILHPKYELYNKYLQNIDDILNMYNIGDELEIRIGKFTTNSNFKSNIQEYKYLKLINYLKTNNDFIFSFNNYTINICPNGIKIVKDNITKSKFIIKKIKKSKLDIIDIGIRIALSKELIMHDYPIVHRVTKYRYRSTFTHKSNNYKIDISKDNSKGVVQYQCEIEFLKLPNKQEILDIISNIISIIES